MEPPDEEAPQRINFTSHYATLVTTAAEFFSEAQRDGRYHHDHMARSIHKALKQEERCLYRPTNKTYYSPRALLGLATATKDDIERAMQLQTQLEIYNKTPPVDFHAEW